MRASHPVHGWLARKKGNNPVTVATVELRVRGGDTVRFGGSLTLY